MILLSPEMLSSDGFESLLQKREFSSRLCALGVDEVHLCNSWGDSFRPCFRQIGLVRHRMPSGTKLILLTATLARGPPTTNILNTFGLRAGGFHLIRRPNLRPDIQILLRPLTRGPSGPAYPDFLWILSSKRKAVAFCPTIAHGQRVALYLRSKLPPSVDPYRFIRTYSALKWNDFNEATLQRFREDHDAMIIIATDTLMVGVDLPNVEDVVLAVAPETPDEMLQKIGRAGRDTARVSHARGIVYMAKDTMDIARKQVGGGEAKKATNTAAASPKKPARLLNPAMARMIAADCKTAAQNAIYDNPEADEPCLCGTCQGRPTPAPHICRCSGCIPELDDHQDPPAHGPSPSRSSSSQGPRVSSYEGHDSTRALPLPVLSPHSSGPRTAHRGPACLCLHA